MFGEFVAGPRSSTPGAAATARRARSRDAADRAGGLAAQHQVSVADLQVPAVAPELLDDAAVQCASHVLSAMSPMLPERRRCGSGISSLNAKRRRSAVSRSAMDRSAVFIVPMTSTLSVTANGSFDTAAGRSSCRASILDERDELAEEAWGCCLG